MGRPAAAQMQAGNNISFNFLSSTSWVKWRFVVFLVCVLCHPAVPQSIVESLPGYNGPLPFKLETGYIGVGNEEEVQLFYYFVESENDPVQDPLMLWLTGGPGCSTLSAIFYEIGPLTYDFEAFDGSLPSLLLNPYSWTQIASIIFVDTPAGTGFSYSNTSEGYHSTDQNAPEDIYTFLQKWLLKHPNFLKNPLYISGDSYGGKWIPVVAWKVSEANEAGVVPRLQLQGYTVGNPFTDTDIDGNSRVTFAHRLALLSDKYYQMAKIHCNGNYVKPDLSNAWCLLALQKYKDCTQNICDDNILEPKCQFRSPKPESLIFEQNVLEDKTTKMLLQINHEKRWCRNANYELAYVWANDPSVQEALHIREGTIEEWSRCNYSLSYDKDVDSVIQYHHLLSTKRYRALVYSGDHDFYIPYVGTLEWINQLNLTTDDDWRQWTVDGEIAGYTEVFRRGEEYFLTFATVKGAGHTAPEYKPKECFAMIERFLSTFPL